MGATQGFIAQVGYKAGGVAQAGDFTAIGPLRDTNLDQSRAEIPTNTKASAATGYESTTPGLKGGTISGSMQWEYDDPAFAALNAAYQNGTPMGIAFLDGPLDSGNGLVADFKVFGWNITQELEGVVSVDVTFKISHEGTDPVWVEGGAN